MLFYRHRKNKRLKRLHQIHHHKINRMQQHEKRHLLKIKTHHPHQTDKLQRWNDWHLYHHVSALFNSRSTHHSKVKNQVALWKFNIREQLKRAPDSQARRQILKRYNKLVVNQRKLKVIFREKEAREEQLHRSRLPMVVSQAHFSAGPKQPSLHRGVSKQDLIREIHHINQTLSRLEERNDSHRRRPAHHGTRQRKQPLIIKSHKRAETDPVRQLEITGGKRPHRNWIQMAYHGFQLLNGVIWLVLTLILVFIAYLVISR